MVSKSKLKRMQKKKEEDEKRLKEESMQKQDKSKEELLKEEEAQRVLADDNKEYIIASGELLSHPTSPDISIGGFSVSLRGTELVADTELKINRKQRYGLIGINGCGKTTMLYALGSGMIKFPENMTTFYLEHEAPAVSMSALDYVVESVVLERKELTKQLESMEEVDEDEINRISLRLDELDEETARSRAAKILYGLGFDAKMQKKKCLEFSGGWRMRISLACALFINPDLLLLDSPTAHLDLEAVVWLERYLKNFSKSMIIVSSNQEFLNNVCTSIMHLGNKKLTYYRGNYDTYVSTRDNLEANQQKKYEWEQNQIKHVKKYVAKFASGTRASQAKSKQKLLAKMEEKGLTQAVVKEKPLNYRFHPAVDLHPPIIRFDKVSFTYPPSEIDPKPEPIFTDVSFSVDLDSRIALLGRNGSGKSTFMKLLANVMKPSGGVREINAHCRIGYFNQHLHTILDPELSPLEWMFKMFPDEEKTDSQGTYMRQQLGPFGITGKLQTTPIKTMSQGQRSALMIAYLAYLKPSVLLLDEPTNSLSLQATDGLARALNCWNGGVVVISHDFRLINQLSIKRPNEPDRSVEIWEVGNGTIERYKGDISDYKDQILNEIDEGSKDF